MNKAVVIGNLTNEPDMRATLSGISVCTFTVAVNRLSLIHISEPTRPY